MEPRFLEKLPPRFRERWRGNLIALAVVIALFVIPPRCGEYGIVAFFTIAWAANSAYYLSRFRWAQPTPSRWAFLLFAVMTLSFGSPIVVGWVTKSFDAIGFLGFIIGDIALLVLAIAYRKVFFPGIFGNERRGIVGEFTMVRAAQRETRTQSDENISKIRDAFSQSRKK
jgi:hypothetical protein